MIGALLAKRGSVAAVGVGGALCRRLVSKEGK